MMGGGKVRRERVSTRHSQQRGLGDVALGSQAAVRDAVRHLALPEEVAGTGRLQPPPRGLPLEIATTLLPLHRGKILLLMAAQCLPNLATCIQGT